MLKVPVWLSGNVLHSINVVAVCRARLVPLWVTVLGWINHLVVVVVVYLYSASRSASDALIVP